MRDRNPVSVFGSRIGRRRLLQGSFLGGVGLAAASVVGCGDDEEAPSPTPPAGTQPAAGTTPSPTAAPVRGGTLTLHDNGDPASFDYIKTWSYRSMMHNSMVYPRLLKFATGPDVGPLDYGITTDLATSLPEQPDELTYVFKLRPAKWENKEPLNGRALTAEDVVAAWQRLKAEHPSRLLFADVLRVEAISADTVRFELSKPLGPFLNHIAHQGYFYIMPKELFGTGRLEKDMWSAGPFIFDGYQVGAEVRYKRNPDYFIKDRPFLDAVVYKIIADPSTTVSALRSKQLDSLAWTAVVGPNDVESLKRDLPGATFLPYLAQGNSWLGFDLNDPVFRDKRVRQAISLALNRDDLVRVSVEGAWALPYGVLSQWYFDPKQNAFPNAKYYQHNLQEAKALLSAALGSTSLPEYTLIGSAVWSPTQLQQTELIQQQLKAIGIETRLQQLPFAEYYAKTVVAGKWEGGMAASANLVGADPNEYFTSFWEPDSPRLIAPGLKPLLEADTELRNAIEKQRRILDPEQRKAAIRDVVNIMADRMYNVPTTVGQFYHVHQANVHLWWIFTYAQEYLIDAYKTS